MEKQIDANEILQAAKLLVERYGKDAIKRAEERAHKAEIGEFPSEKDIALRILTEVEGLLSPQTS